MLWNQTYRDGLGLMESVDHVGAVGGSFILAASAEKISKAWVDSLQTSSTLSMALVLLHSHRRWTWHWGNLGRGSKSEHEWLGIECTHRGTSCQRFVYIMWIYTVASMLTYSGSNHCTAVASGDVSYAILTSTACSAFKLRLETSIFKVSPNWESPSNLVPISNYR